MTDTSRFEVLQQAATAVVAGAERSVRDARELRAKIESERVERRVRDEDRRARLDMAAE